MCFNYSHSARISLAEGNLLSKHCTIYVPVSCPSMHLLYTRCISLTLDKFWLSSMSKLRSVEIPLTTSPPPL